MRVPAFVFVRSSIFPRIACDGHERVAVEPVAAPLPEMDAEAICERDEARAELRGSEDDAYRLYLNGVGVDEALSLLDAAATREDGTSTAPRRCSAIPTMSGTRRTWRRAGATRRLRPRCGTRRARAPNAAAGQSG